MQLLLTLISIPLLLAKFSILRLLSSAIILAKFLIPYCSYTLLTKNKFILYSEESEKLDHHTHYMKFKKAYSYIEEFWEGNPDVDRAWVPWDWATTVKQQFKNNSIVLFSPSNSTLHSVKANYDHLITQRTQLYGNLWFKTNKKIYC